MRPFLRSVTARSPLCPATSPGQPLPYDRGEIVFVGDAGIKKGNQLSLDIALLPASTFTETYFTRFLKIVKSRAEARVVARHHILPAQA